MFTPSPNQGFNPEIGGVMPPISHEQLSLPQQILSDQRYFLYDHMAEVVEHGEISMDQAKYHLELAEHDPEYAINLEQRFTRAGGFLGKNALF